MKRIATVFMLMLLLSPYFYPQSDNSLLTESENTSAYIPGEYYMENFEGDVFPPPGWLSVSIAGSEGWELSYEEAFLSFYCAFISRQYSGRQVGKDYLITPKISVELGDSLIFYIRPQRSETAPDNFLVLASLMNEMPSYNHSVDSAFTDTLMAVSLSELSMDWRKCAVSLDKYSGKQIFIGFKYLNENGRGLYLDEVKIGKPPAKDIAFLSAEMNRFAKINNAFEMTVYYVNNSYDKQSFDIVFDVPDVDYSSRKTFKNVEPNHVVEAHFNAWKPELVRDFNIAIYSELSGDEVLSNNSYDAVIKALEQADTMSWHNEVKLEETRHAAGTAFYLKKSGDRTVPDTGFIYVLGGHLYTDSSVVFRNTILKYNTLTKNWSKAKTVLPENLSEFSAVQLNGKIYIAGGETSVFGSGSNLYIYDIEADTIGKGDDLLSPVRLYAAGVYGDSLIYIIGGFYSKYNYGIMESKNIVQIYNINENKWKYGTSILEPRSGLNGSIIGNKIIIAGGEGNNGSNIASAEKGLINPDNPYEITWQKIEFPGGGQFGLSAGPWRGNNYKYIIFAGDGTADYVHPYDYYKYYNYYKDDIWIYNIEKDEWFAGPDKRISNVSMNLVPVVRNDSAYMALIVGVEHEWLYIGKADTNFVGVIDEPEVPTVYSLSQNYPNPFNPSTVIKYSIAEAGQVELKIYNMLGQEIRTLVNEMKNAGNYEVKFNAGGMNLSSGVYIYRIKSGSFVQTKKLMLLK